MESSEYHTGNLREFSVLLSEEDFKIVMDAIKSKSASHESLAVVGDIIVSSARGYN